MPRTPSHLVPLNVFADIVRIAQAETPLADRLNAANARVDRFLADLREYEKGTVAEGHVTAATLRKQLRGKLKRASTRWIGTEEIRIMRQALVRLDAHGE